MPTEENLSVTRPVARYHDLVVVLCPHTLTFYTSFISHTRAPRAEPPASHVLSPSLPPICFLQGFYYPRRKQTVLPRVSATGAKPVKQALLTKIRPHFPLV